MGDKLLRRRRSSLAGAAPAVAPLAAMGARRIGRAAGAGLADIGTASGRKRVKPAFIGAVLAERSQECYMYGFTRASADFGAMRLLRAAAL